MVGLFKFLLQFRLGKASPAKGMLGIGVLVISVFAMSAALPVVSADAQFRFNRKSVVEFFFGPREVRREKTNRQPSQPVKRRKSASKSASPLVAKAAAIPEKSENARKVLVIGDFMASSLADGLQTAFRDAPGMVILKKANGSSGLVRDDFYNWPEVLPAMLDDIQPAVAIIMIGSNDRQQLRQGKNRIPVGSELWNSQYKQRVELLAKAVRSRNIPLIWVGAPPYKSATMSADILAINGMFKTVVDDNEGEYVDIWDGFVDANGKFVYTGSDIKGQQVRLRTKDGIRMTRAGTRKLAFYLEKPIRRLLGNAANDAIAALGEDNQPDLTVQQPGKIAMITRTNPIGMTDPGLDGFSELLGETPTLPASLTPTPLDDLILDGKTSAPPQGRADNFSWPN
ncbi:MAG: DUF459 domain-containing protein [Rhizobiaceae bacterium]|nr:DUF459 domain-containing protein [Rhizobiaceae bacterium]